MSVNYFTVNPVYTITGSRLAIPGWGSPAPSDVMLTGVWEAEVATVVEILRRMGLDEIKVAKNYWPSDFSQHVAEDPGPPDSTGTRCSECGLLLRDCDCSGFVAR